MKLTHVDEVIKDYGVEMVADMVAILKQRGSQNLVNEISTSIITDIEGVTNVIKMPEYGYFASEGRAAGSFPPLKSIEDWLGSRGMDIALAFPIARSIASLGTKANASHFLAEFKTTKAMEDDVLEAYSQDVQEVLTDYVNKLNKE